MFNLEKSIIFSKAYAQERGFMDWFRNEVCGDNADVIHCLVNLDLNSIIVLLNLLIRVVLGFAGIILIIVLIYNGYLYMTSGGNPDRLAAAKLKLLWTFVGFILVILAYLIVFFLFSHFGPPGEQFNPFI